MPRVSRAQSAVSTGTARAGWYVSTEAQPQRRDRLVQQCPERFLGRMIGLSLLAISLAFSTPAWSTVFYSKEGALKLAFPQADLVQTRHVFLSEQQLERVAALCGERPKSRLLTVYEGFKAGVSLGVALIDTHTVRTMPETFMTVLDPSGSIQAVHILAFHEPAEYMPSRGWLGQFKARRGSSPLRVRRELAGIAGATMSAEAVARGTRMILALYETALRPPVATASRILTRSRAVANERTMR